MNVTYGHLFISKSTFSLIFKIEPYKAFIIFLKIKYVTSQLILFTVIYVLMDNVFLVFIAKIF